MRRTATGMSTGPGRPGYPPASSTNAMRGAPGPIPFAPAAQLKQQQFVRSAPPLGLGPRGLILQPIPPTQASQPTETGILIESQYVQSIPHRADSSSPFTADSSQLKRAKLEEQQQHDEEVNVQGQLQVALARIRALEHEVSELKTEIQLKEIEDEHSNKFGKQLQEKADNLEFRERELKETEELLRSRSITKDTTVSQSSSQEKTSSVSSAAPLTVGKEEAQDGHKPQLNKNISLFLEMIRSELTVLFRHRPVDEEEREEECEECTDEQGKENGEDLGKKAEAVDENERRRLGQGNPASSPTRVSPFLGASTPSGRARSPEGGRKGAHSPPSSPLSMTSVASPMHRGFFFPSGSADASITESTLLSFLAMPDRDLTPRMLESDYGSGAAASLLRTVGIILRGKQPTSALVEPLRQFVVPKSKHSIEVVLSAIRVLYLAATKFVDVRAAVLSDSILIDALLVRLNTDDAGSIIVEVAILRLFLVLVRGWLHSNDPTSLKLLNPLLAVHGPLAKRMSQADRTVARQCAVDLLDLLMQKKSEALPEQFPMKETWDMVMSPFGTGGAAGVARCTVFIANYGEDAIQFLLHHKLLTNLIDVMYAGECQGKPDRQALALLAKVWRVLKTIELTDEEKHRLIASLFSLREVRGTGDTGHVVSRAEMILKSLSCLPA